MAKKQSFSDKSKGKDKTDVVSIKCVVSIFDEDTQSWKFREKMVRVKSTAELADMKF
ncbi:MAG: hypothetical protein WBQ23_03540 [Bacteroidota bacterium]